MNKLFLSGAMLLAAASVWTGCQSEDETIPVVPPVQEGTPISFRVQGSKPATYTMPSTVSSIDGFVVNGVVDAATGTGVSKILFNRKSIVRDATSTANSFIYSPIVYFPTGATQAVFTAYSPISAKVGIDNGKFVITDWNEYGDNVIEYTTPNPGAGGVQEDLLVAADSIGQINGSTVEFAFKHALSRIYVSVENTTTEPLIITGLSLANIKTKGTLDINEDKWSDAASPALNNKHDINDDYCSVSPLVSFDNYKVLWATENPDTMKWMLPESGVAVAPNAGDLLVVSDEQAMLVLPQITAFADGDTMNHKFEKDDFHLLVEFKLSNLVDTARIYFQDINFAQIGQKSGKGLTFEMGKQYRLSLVFTPEALNGGGGTGGGGGNNSGIKFDVDVDDWKEPVENGAGYIP